MIAVNSDLHLINKNYNLSKRDFLKRLFLLSTTGFLLSSCNQQNEFKSVNLTGVSYGNLPDLIDHNNQKRSMKDFQGKVVLLFFGYTQCPDFCPTTMLELAQVKKNLGAKGEQLQVLFVSVDPERDSPDLLKAYMANFDASFLAFHVPEPALTALAKEFKIIYNKNKTSSLNHYTIDHSAGTYIFDTKGKLRLYSHYGSSIQSLTADIQKLWDEK